MDESRRDFMKTTLLAAGAMGLVSLGNEDDAHARKFDKSIELPSIETDVLVVGAGASGVPAAVAAARAGAKVVLVEEDQSAGGAPVDMYVTYPCGWPRHGIYREMVDKLQKRYDFSWQPVTSEGEYIDRFYTPSAYIMVLRSMIKAESNLTVMCGVRAVDVLVSDCGDRRRVDGVVISRGGGVRQLIKARVTIEATGHGAIAEMAGCEVRYGREAKSDNNEPFGMDTADDVVMPCTWMYISHSVRQDAVPVHDKLQVGNCIDPGMGWYKSNPEECFKRNTGAYLHWGVTVTCKDTRDPHELARAQAEALDKVQPDLERLWDAGYVVYPAPRIGVRECRRVVGEHMITMNDLKSGDKPEDTVAVGHYYLDAWGQKLTEEEKRLPEFGIPYRAFIPKGYEGFMVVGKIISGTHIAMSAYRVQPIVAMMGQAAGIAAAFASADKTGVRNIDISHVRGKMIEAGVPLSK